jgi:hypothetical protein
MVYKWFGLETTRTVFSGLATKPVATGFSGLASKTVARVSRFGDLDLKITTTVS